MSTYKIVLIAALMNLAPVYYVIAGSDTIDSPKSLTDLFRPYWSYKAFWAIPSIDKINPRLAFKINSEGRIIGRSRCYEIERLEQMRIFDPLAKMVNEQLDYIRKQYGKLVSQTNPEKDFEITAEFRNEEHEIEKISTFKLDDLKSSIQIEKDRIEAKRYIYQLMPSYFCYHVL